MGFMLVARRALEKRRVERDLWNQEGGRQAISKEQPDLAKIFETMTDTQIQEYGLLLAISEGVGEALAQAIRDIEQPKLTTSP